MHLIFICHHHHHLITHRSLSSILSLGADAAEVPIINVLNHHDVSSSRGQWGRKIATMDVNLLSEYMLQNMESISAIVPSDAEKIPREFISYTCRAFPDHTSAKGVCKKFSETYGMNLIRDVSIQRGREKQAICEAEPHARDQVHHTGGDELPRSSLSSRYMLTDNSQRSKLLSKIREMWYEIFNENVHEIQSITTELRDRVQEMVVKSQQTYCEYCLIFVGQIEEYVRTHKTEIEHALLKMCAQAPSRTYEQICYTAVLLYGPQVIDYILREETPARVCKPFCENPSLEF